MQQHRLLLICVWIYLCHSNYYESRSLSNLTCPIKYITCPCGTTDKLTIAVKQCQIKKSPIQCMPCDSISDESRCSIYKKCKSCFSTTITNVNSTDIKDCGCRLSNGKCKCPSSYIDWLGESLMSLSSSRPTVASQIKLKRQARDSSKPTVECMTPIDPEFGKAMVEVKVITAGDAVKYRCREGFTMIGSATRHCGDNGKWTGERPTCEKLCPYPVLKHNDGIMNVNVNPGRKDNLLDTSGNIVLSEIEFICKSGYDLVGSPRVRCVAGGTWDRDPPTCVTRSAISLTTVPTASAPNLCSKPDELEHGNMKWTTSNLPINRIANMFEVGTSMEYTCNHPYELNGQSKQYCLASGQWSGQRPKCSPVCGKGMEPKAPHAINGTVAKVNGYPWQVGITTYLSRAEIRYIHCGGVVISERWVLTAAHCITETHSKVLINSTAFLLFFGKHFADRDNDDNDVTAIKVSQLVLHPQYNPDTFDNDLALMLLQSPLVFNYLVSPLCLPDFNSMITFEEGRRGVVTGWGNTDNKGTAAVVLMMIELPIVDSKKCEESYRKHDFKSITVTDNMFCAGESEGGKNTCEGDSGGAMAFLENGRYVLEGIVSWGNKDDCAAAGFYGGFVRVRNFLNWIHNYVGLSVPG